MKLRNTRIQFNSIAKI